MFVGEKLELNGGEPQIAKNIWTLYNMYMADQTDFLVLEVAPKTEYINPWLDYVATQGGNVPGQYRPHQDVSPVEQELVGYSVQVGRACELARLGLDREADLRLVQTREQLDRFVDGPVRHSVEYARGAVLLDSIAAVASARHDADALNAAYATMHSNVVKDLIWFGRLATPRIGGRRHQIGRSSNGTDQKYAGLYAERAELGMLTGYRGVFAMPPLPHHDRTSNRAGGSHDMVLIAKREWGLVPPGDEAGSPFITRTVQAKRACLALCPAPSRVEGSGTVLRKERTRYHGGIVLSSTHCDVGEPGIGLDMTAARLEQEADRTLAKQAARALETDRRRLTGRLLSPVARRLGSKAVAGKGQMVNVVALPDDGPATEVNIRLVSVAPS